MGPSTTGVSGTCLGIILTTGDHLAMLFTANNRALYEIIVDRGSNRELCAGSVAMVFEKMGGEVVYFGKPYPEVYNQSINNKNKKL